jgi:trimethylamine:corrinoid methyltransferase-like protein
VVDRQTLDVWRAKGAKDSAANAADIVQRVVREHKPELLPRETEERLDAAVKEMSRTGALVA